MISPLIVCVCMCVHVRACGHVCETGATVDLTVDEALLARYREKLAGQVTALRAYSARNGIDFFSVSTATPFEELVLRFLRATGVSH